MELSDYRKELDSIDAQMLELFKQRMNTVRGVAEYKKENKLPVLQQGREREILAAAAARISRSLPCWRTGSLFSFLYSATPRTVFILCLKSSSICASIESSSFL